MQRKRRRLPRGKGRGGGSGRGSGSREDGGRGLFSAGEGSGEGSGPGGAAEDATDTEPHHRLHQTPLQFHRIPPILLPHPPATKPPWNPTTSTISPPSQKAPASPATPSPSAPGSSTYVYMFPTTKLPCLLCNRLRDALRKRRIRCGGANERSWLMEGSCTGISRGGCTRRRC